MSDFDFTPMGAQDTGTVWSGFLMIVIFAVPCVCIAFFLNFVPAPWNWLGVGMGAGALGLWIYQHLV